MHLKSRYHNKANEPEVLGFAAISYWILLQSTVYTQQLNISCSLSSG